MLYKNCLQKRYNFWVNFNYENCCGYIWTMEKKKTKTEMDVLPVYVM